MKNIRFFRIIILTCIMTAATIGAGKAYAQTQGQENGGNNLTEQPAGQPDPNALSGESEQDETGNNSESSNKEKKLKDPETEPIVSQEDIKKPVYYENCQAVFSRLVDENGLVDYALLRRKRINLIKAAKDFENITPLQMLSSSTNEKIAMWINAHNIFTLKLIVDNYPIQPRWYMLFYPENSIMQIPAAWTKNYFKVMGIEYNLREIEKDILQERFKDPRICFALSYATKGGATLRNEAYSPDKLDEQLNEQVRNYLAKPSGIYINTTEKVVYLSNIFSTNKEVFIEKYADVKRFRTRSPEIKAYFNFLVNYIPESDTVYLEDENYTVKFIEYNWELNEIPLR